MTVISTPPRVGGRGRAQELLSDLPSDVAEVTINFSDTEAVTPSFVDEVVRLVLVERNASLLILSGLPKRARELALRSAGSRSVTDRLKVS